MDFSKDSLPSISDELLKNYSLIREGDLVMADASEDYNGIGESIEIKNIGFRLYHYYTVVIMLQLSRHMSLIATFMQNQLIKNTKKDDSID